MKTNLTFLMLIFISALQAQIVATHSDAALTLECKECYSDFKSGRMIAIEAPNGLQGYSIIISDADEASGENILTSNITNDATNFIYTILDDQYVSDFNKKKSKKQFSGTKMKIMFMKQNDASHTRSKIINFESKQKPPAGNDSETTSISDYIDKNFRNKENLNFYTPYDDKNNKVFLYFDENGKMLNNQPVNVDQSDKFHFIIACYEKDKNKYDVDVIKGSYSPSDLVIKPVEKINTNGPKTESDNAKLKLYEPTQIELIKGPFTTETFEFQISYIDSVEKKYKHSKLYSFNINKLYHVGVGVSFIGTNLSNPEYRTVFNGTDTTIQSYNGGSRSMLTFNAIWYWSVLQQNSRGSIITSGRDILKDEPTWSLKRVFPTVGVSLDGNFNENFFVGAVYEFARGGSIIGGMHYGKVKRLAMPDFQEGVTKFSGIDSDIKTENVYKTGWFIGVNLDTRIFNTLFNKQ